jgi:hypothetical protein
MGAALKQLSDATTPLYQSLNEAQKGRFLVLARYLHHKHEYQHHWSQHQDEHHDDERH